MAWKPTAKGWLLGVVLAPVCLVLAVVVLIVVLRQIDIATGQDHRCANISDAETIKMADEYMAASAERSNKADSEQMSRLLRAHKVSFEPNGDGVNVVYSNPETGRPELFVGVFDDCDEKLFGYSSPPVSPGGRAWPAPAGAGR